MIRPGIQVVRLGQRGKGQIVALDDADAVVLWQRGRKRERLPQSDLVWCGLKLHTCDGLPAKVIELGRNKIRLRFWDGGCHWVATSELAPREAKQDVVAEQ